MAPIPGWVYVMLGIFMTAASQLIKREDGSKPLIIFLYVGILFIVIGFGKYIFKAKSRKKQEKPVSTKHPSHHAVHPHHQRAHPPQPRQAVHHRVSHSQTPSQSQHHVQRVSQQQSQQTQHPSIIACPACGTRHYNYANYCMKCGTKIRKHK